NGLLNLVLTDVKCNANKSDFLAAMQHTESWLGRFSKHSQVPSELATLADKIQWDLSYERTFSVGRAIYLRLHNDAKLWQLGRQFVNADPARLSQLFSNTQL